MKYFLPGYLRLFWIELIVLAINVFIFAVGWFLNSQNSLPKILVELYSNPLIFLSFQVILFYSILHMITSRGEKNNLENLQREVAALKESNQSPKTLEKFNLDNMLEISVVIFFQLLSLVGILLLFWLGKENVVDFWRNTWLVIIYGLLISFFVTIVLLVVKSFRSGQKGMILAILTIPSLITLAILVIYPQFYNQNGSPTDYQITNEASSSAELAVQDKTSDWKTFESTVFSNFTYSIKYPSKIKVLLESPEGSGAVFSNLTEDEDIIWITYNNLIPEKSFKESAVYSATYSLYGGGTELIQQTSKIVDGQTMYINKIKMEDGSIHLQALIADPRVTTKEGAVYNIANLNLTVISEEEFDLMLSTFKFL